MIALHEHRVLEAETYFRDALRLDPNEAIARSAMDKILEAKAGIPAPPG